MSGFRIVIPARLGSTRLPRKVLRTLAGKPLVQWTWEAACRVAGPESVVIATDDVEVLAACTAFGATVRMTDPAHQSGTDRVNEIATAAGWDDAQIVVNLQGDEPLMPVAMIVEAAKLLADDASADIATLCHPLHALEDWLNPNFVKVVRAANGHALYFSRAPIPWKREGTSPTSPLPAGLAFRHIGLYAYRVGALRRFSALPTSPLENCEALEQLRALEAGLRIAVGVSDVPPPRGVDTEADLAVVAAVLEARA
ncbi:3-deoxy-manno-octulosonate cytidylyltransferase [Nevskia ramosa]|uniref:3-deoxy-manno-octulosonate cytidylyltransferase n=1 Tax=Nevskia ramosa TaxID=64002 RepID=UPI0023534C59|nr:3-deoxy-manno-octulosonate cytidylyltransferase [Nevskia ramosa]